MSASLERGLDAVACSVRPGRPLDYRLGRITPLGIEFYIDRHPDLGTLKESNCLAYRPEWSSRFRKVVWWEPNSIALDEESDTSAPNPSRPTVSVDASCSEACT